MQSTFFLYVIVSKGTAIFKLLSGLHSAFLVKQTTSWFATLTYKDEALLVRRNAFLVLDFGLDIVDCIIAFALQCDRLSSQCL